MLGDPLTSITSNIQDSGAPTCVSVDIIIESMLEKSMRE